MWEKTLPVRVPVECIASSSSVVSNSVLIPWTKMSDWTVSQSSQLSHRPKEEKTLNSPLCFSDKAPDVLELCCYGSSGEEHIFKCFECFFPPSFYWCCLFSPAITLWWSPHQSVALRFLWFCRKSQSLCWLLCPWMCKAWLKRPYCFWSFTSKDLDVYSRSASGIFSYFSACLVF